MKRVHEVYTSQRCSSCDYSAKHNQKSHGWFYRRNYGYKLNAECNAACNILQQFTKELKVVPTIHSFSNEVDLLDRGCTTQPVQNICISTG